MVDKPNALPTNRVVRWVAIGVLICLAIALYFRAGTHLPPITAPAPGASADSAS